MARTYRQFYHLMGNHEYFTKTQFDVTGYYNSRFSSKVVNLLIRLSTSLQKAVQDAVKLPKYLIVVLEDDLMRFAQYTGSGTPTIYGNLIESVVKDILATVKEQKDQLPVKAKKRGGVPNDILGCSSTSQNVFE